jgi:type IV secretory pathway VirB6-like protein
VLSPIHFVESNIEKNSIRILKRPVEFRNYLLLVHNVTTRIPFLFSFFPFLWGGGGIVFRKMLSPFLSLFLSLYIYFYIYIPLMFNTLIYVFLLLCLCILIVYLCIFIVPTGTLWLP